VLFEPGTYGSRANLSTFKWVLHRRGRLGARPTDVVINGSVQVRNRCFRALPLRSIFLAVAVKSGRSRGLSGLGMQRR